jgi:phosphate-selective porin OprO/OprP
VQNATGLTTEVDAQAWQVVSTFVLTGEDAAYRGVRPKQNFGEGGLGSLELVARYGELHVGDEAFDFQLADPARSARSARGLALALTGT